MITIKTAEQKGLIEYLTKNKIQCRPFWRPMNQLRMFKNDIYVQQYDISNTEYQSCLSIPCSSGIIDEELVVVEKKIKSYFDKS
jgi:dTDP-4-amino-4,6-dideoxygalactose transaminase